MRPSLLILLVFFQSLLLTAQDPITYAGKEIATSANVSVPVRVDNFSDVGAISLKIQFDPAIISFQSVSDNAFPGIQSGIVGNIIHIAWATDGISAAPILANGSLLLNLNFTVILSGTSQLNWIDDDGGTGCEYMRFSNLLPFNDVPTGTYYINGWVSTLSFTFDRDYASDAIIALPQNGQAPYTYSWVGPATQTGNAQSLIPSDGYGMYSVTVTDALGAEVSGQYYYGPVQNISSGLDYPGLQLAIDALPTEAGDTLRLIGAVYESDIMVNKSLTIQGRGPSISVIYPNPLVPDVPDCSPTGGTPHHGIIVAADNVKIQDIKVDGGTSRSFRMGITSYYWTGSNFNNTSVQDVEVTNIYYRGIVLRRNGGITTGHSVVRATVTHGGCDEQGFAILGFNADALSITGCYVEDWPQGIATGNYTGSFSACNIQGNEVVDVDNQAYTLTYNGTGSIFNDNTATFNDPLNQGTGLVSYQDELSITNCNFSGAFTGISIGYQTLTADKLIIGPGNTIQGFPTAGRDGSVGVHITDESWPGAARNVTLRENLIQDYETGILVKPVNGMTASVNIDGNDIQAKKHQPDSDDACIKVDGDLGGDVLIRNNNLALDYASPFPAPPYPVSRDLRGIWLLNGADADIQENSILFLQRKTELNEIGLKMDPGTEASITGNTMNDGDIGVLLNPICLAVIQENTISGNQDYGVKNLNSNVVDATRNWWGDPSGPYNASFNTCGTANAVTDNVDVCQWYTQAAMTPTDLNGCFIGIYNITGGGSYCQGGGGVEIGLSGSETGVEYRLLLDGVNTGSPVAGTGSAISFGMQLGAGTYTAKASHLFTGCTDVDMSGNAMVSVDPCGLSGYFNYYNTARTPLNNVQVILKSGTTALDTSITDATGYFSFGNVPAGIYEVHASTSKSTAYAVNVTDAGQVNAWQVGPSYPIEKIRWLASDVSRTSPPSYITSADASRIMFYFVTQGNPAWSAPAGLWSFWNANETISANPWTNGAVPTIEVSNTAQPTYNFFGLATGDFNGSLIPGNSKSNEASIKVQDGDALYMVPGMQADIRVKTASVLEVGAISLILSYPEESLAIQDVFLGEDAEHSLLFSAENGMLRIGWMNQSPLLLKTDECLLTIRVRLLKAIPGGRQLRFQAVEDPTNELADEMFIPIPATILRIDRIESTALGTEDLSNIFQLSLHSSPNPASDQVNLNLGLPDAGRYLLEVSNTLGQSILLREIKAVEAGTIRLSIETSHWESGIYFASLRCISKNISHKIQKKLVIR